MSGESVQEPRAPSGDEVAALRYRPGFMEIIQSFWRYPTAYGLAIAFVASLVEQPALCVVGGLGVAACLILFALSADLVVGKQSIQFRELLGLLKIREVPLEKIAEIGVAKHSRWTEAKVALVLEGARGRSLFPLPLKSYELSVRGDRVFQARVVKELLARRGDIPVTDAAGRLLAGKLGVAWKHRLPTLVSTGAFAMLLSYVLFLSVHELGVSMDYVVPTGLALVFMPLVVCLERDSKGKAVLASLGVNAAPFVGAAFGGAYISGGMEYMPMIYGAGIALTLGGFLAALPLRLRALHIAVGEAALAGALIFVAWSATLRGTIPAQEFLLTPPSEGASFSRDGDALVLHGSKDGRQTVHFLNPQTHLVETVSFQGGEWTLACLPVAGGRALCVVKKEKEHGLWIADSGGEARELFSARMIWASRLGLSPDGEAFVFLATEEKPGAEEAKRTGAKTECESTPVILDLRTLDVRPLDFAKEEGLWSLTWRADGRVVWSTIRDRNEQGAGTFSLWSWAPGEEGPRLEFESHEPWSNVSVSPNCEMAFVRTGKPDAEMCRIVHFAQRRSVDVPAVKLPYVNSERCWSADGRTLVAIPDDNPGALLVIHTDTEEASMVYESPFGEVREPVLSPGADRVAFCVADEWAAVHVVNLTTRRARRLRPIAHSLFLGGPSLTGPLAWSPSGRLLAVTAFGHPPAQMHLHGASAVWLARVP